VCLESTLSHLAVAAGALPAGRAALRLVLVDNGPGAVERSAALAVAALALAVPANAVLFLLSPLLYTPVFALMALAVGGKLLLQPGLRLVRERDRAAALALFNLASWYPPALLGVVSIHLMIRSV